MARQTGERLARRLATNVKLSGLDDVLRPVFDRFRAERDAGEGFGDFCDRVGMGEPRRHEMTACRP